jgi:hypothetical protein
LGEFSTRVRYSKPLAGFMDGLPIQTVRSAEYVYSYRTHIDRSLEKTLSSDDTKDLQFGIRMPSKKVGLLETLAEQKRFAEDVMSTMNSINDTSSSFSQQTVCSATDVGHQFASAKWFSIQEGRYIEGSVFGDTYTNMPIMATGLAFRPAWAPATPGFQMGTPPGSVSPPDSLEHQARLNLVFQSMRPGRAESGIAESLIDLMRGNFPGFLTGLRRWYRLLYDPKEALKFLPRALGGDYLSSQFAWLPLRDDFIHAIKAMLKLHNLIYGDGVRKHRTLQWDAKFSETGDIPPLTSQYGPSGLIVNFGMDRSMPRMRTTASFDTRLSTRMVPIARPTVGALSFLDQVDDKLEQVGLWYPALGWDLLPYSWLADWAVHLGTSIDNGLRFGNEPGLVKIDYAWATTVYRVLTEVEFGKNSWQQGANVYKAVGHPKTLSVFKFRHGATPYGFGLDLSGLTSTQISVLVALGLVKRR